MKSKTRISMKKATREKIRNYLIDAAIKFTEMFEDDLDGQNSEDSQVAIRCVYEKFKNTFNFKIKSMGEYRAFIEWLRGLPLDIDYTWYNERKRIEEWFNQTPEESSKYSDDSVDNLYWQLLAREFFVLVDKFKIKETPVKESTIVSEEVESIDLDDYYIEIEYGVDEDSDSDSDDYEPYIPYHDMKLFFNNIMRLTPPEVIDGVEYHGVYTLSNTLSLLIHVSDDGDFAIVRESGADKLEKP